MFSRALSFTLIVIAVGCSEEVPVPASEDTNMTTDGYSRTCTADPDCILVFTGDVCGCGCTQEAIAATEGSRFANETEEKRNACTDVLSCQPCPETMRAVCDQGACNAVMK